MVTWVLTDVNDSGSGPLSSCANHDRMEGLLKRLSEEW